MLCPSCTDSRFGSEQTSVKRTQDVCKPETRKDYNRLQSTSNDDINCAACGDIIDCHSITCDICSDVYHSHCSGMSEEAFVILCSIIKHSDSDRIPSQNV